jgi:hypothetical protein
MNGRFVSASRQSVRTGRQAEQCDADRWSDQDSEPVKDVEQRERLDLAFTGLVRDVRGRPG